jgi:predicted MFS family arabinose efflux permease
MDNIDSLVIENPNPEKKHNEYQIVFLMAFVSFLATTDSMLLMPLSDVLMKNFQISAQSSTLVISVYSIFAGISGFLSASIMDRFDRKYLLIGTFIGFTAGTWLCGYATDYTLFVFLRGITGVFGGVVGGVGVAIVSDLIPYQRRATAMSIISLSFAVAAITGVPLGIHLANTYNLAMPFKILAFISAVTLIPIMLWLPKINTHLVDKIDFHSPMRTIGNTLKDLNQVWALLLSILLVFSHFVVLQFIVPYMENNVGFSKKLVPVMYAFGGICAIATAPFIGKISDKKGNFPSFVVLMILSFVPIILSTHLKQANMAIAIFVCSTFFILAAGRIIPAYTIMSGATIPEKRGAFMSMRSASMELGTAMASLVSGFIVKIGADGIVHHFNWVGYISVATGLFCIYIASRIRIVSHK